MTVFATLVVICTLTYLRATNALLGVIAILLLEIGLTVGKLLNSVTDLCRMLKDDEPPDVEGAIRQMEEALRRFDAGHTERIIADANRALDAIDNLERLSVAKAPSGPQTMQQAPPNWLEPGIKES